MGGVGVGCGGGVGVGGGGGGGGGVDGFLLSVHLSIPPTFKGFSGQMYDQRSSIWSFC